MPPRRPSPPQAPPRLSKPRLSKPRPPLQRRPASPRALAEALISGEAPLDDDARDAAFAGLLRRARRATTEADLLDALAALAALLDDEALARALLRGDAGSGAQLVYACPRCAAEVPFVEEGGYLIGEDLDAPEEALSWSGDGAGLAAGDGDAVLLLPQLCAETEYFRVARRLLQLCGEARCPACGARFVPHRAVRLDPVGA